MKRATGRIALAAAAISLAGAACAETIVGTVGVEPDPAVAARSVDRTAVEVTPLAASAPDQQLAERVADALSADPELQGADLAVRVDGGQVTLSGTAPDPDQLDRAADDARAITGNAGAVRVEQPPTILASPAGGKR